MRHLLGLRAILFIILTLVSVTPVLLLGLSIEEPALSRELESAHEKHLLLAQYMTGAIDRYLRDIDIVIRKIGDLEARGVDPAQIGALPEALRLKHICLVDGEGKVLATVTAPGVGAPKTVPTAIRQLLRELPREGGVEFFPARRGDDGEPFIPVGVRAANGNYAYAALTTDYLVEVQRAISFGRKGHAAIVDQRGRVLAHPRVDWQREMRDLSDIEPVRRLMAGETGVAVFYSPAVQTQMVAGFAPIERAGWGVMVPQPMIELEASARELFRVTLMFSLLGAIVAAVLSWILAGYLVRPIIAVACAAQQMAEGNPGRRVHVGRIAPTELRSLANSFNSMVRQLDSAIRAVKRSEQRFRDFAETAADWFWETDSHLRVKFLSNRFRAVSGTAPGRLIGRPALEALQSLIDDPESLAQVRDALMNQRPFNDVKLSWRSDSGSETFCRVSGIPVFGSDQAFRGFRGTGRDVTDAHTLAARLTHQASHDELTGLLNRREFSARLQALATDAEMTESEHAFCFLDLDSFKLVNDTCGHVAGDELLRRIGEILHRCLRRGDAVGRLGGDEFGVLLRGCGLDEAKRIAGTLIDAIGAFRFVWEEKLFRVGASVGLAPIDRGSGSVTAILQAGDAACYAAKHGGRNRVHVFRSSDLEDATQHGEIQWVHRVNEAIENDSLLLYGQEIVPVGAGITGKRSIEILVRLLSDDGSVVSASAFIPALERYSLTTRLDKYVVSKVAHWLANGNSDTRPGLCAVNISGHSLGDAGFLDFVIQEIDRYRVDPGNLCFEITETAAIANLAAATSFIDRLGGMGCQFALDDFGSGLSSFAYLKSLSVPVLKIDGAFVRGMVDNRVDMAMVRTINDMCHLLGKVTIAEGVETETVAEYLGDVGVDFAQGFFYGEPKPLEMLTSSNVS